MTTCSKRRALVCAVLLVLAAARAGWAQDPTGTIEGAVTDRTGSNVPAATVIAEHRDTGFRREVVGSAEGLYRLQLLPIGTYRVTVNAAGFGSAVREAVDVTVGQTIRLDLRLEVSAVVENVTVAGGAPLVDISTNALGRVITGRELVDLPLNGRNFTQLGLLQTGVAPLTAGVATAGGSLRQGQAYAVNGMRPEQNIYLVDGAQNMNRMDGGYAVKIPVDAIAEFRILTQSAPPEYGGTGGATTSVVTRGGGNQFHGSAYEFLRNDAFDARNFFSREVEPLDQHQFGATVGGPLRVNRRVLLRLLRRIPERAGRDDQRDGADRAGAAGGFLRHAAAAAQPGRGRRALPRQPDSAGRHQSGGAERGESLSARQRLAVDLPRHPGRREPARSGRDPLRLQRVVQRPAVRPVLLLGRPQHQSDLGARHRRAGLSDPRRPGDALGAGLGHPNHRRRR